VIEQGASMIVKTLDKLPSMSDLCLIDPKVNSIILFKGTGRRAQHYRSSFGPLAQMDHQVELHHAIPIASSFVSIIKL
jgi:hypothetical protein